MNKKLAVDIPEELLKKLKHESIDQNISLKELVKRKLE